MSCSVNSGLSFTSFTAHHCPNVNPNPLPLLCFFLQAALRSSSLATSRHPKRLAVGVGTLTEHEHPFSPVGVAKTTGSYWDRLDAISDSFELIAKPPPGPRGVFSYEPWILANYIGRPQCGHNSEEFLSKGGGCCVCCDSCPAVLLAWVSSTDNVNAPLPNAVSPAQARNSGVICTTEFSSN